MTDTKSVPWHLWVVGVIALLWNGYGGYDYLMTMTQGESYMASMGYTAEQITYYAGMPSWMAADWAFGVWGGVLAAVLLLLRVKWAYHVFVVSLAALLISVIYTFFLSDGAAIAGQMGMIMNAVLVVMALFFVWYSFRMKTVGVLH